MIPTLEQLPKVAEALIPAIQNHRKVALQGEMGAGKTTLVAAIAEKLGVVDTVSSPTFTLINEYALANGSTLYHIDAYRLESESEAIEIGLEDYLYDEPICFIEWPERIERLLPAGVLYLQLRLLPNGIRELELYESEVDP